MNFIDYNIMYYINGERGAFYKAYDKAFNEQMVREANIKKLSGYGWNYKNFFELGSLKMVFKDGEDEYLYLKDAVMWMGSDGPERCVEIHKIDKLLKYTLGEEIYTNQFGEEVTFKQLTNRRFNYVMDSESNKSVIDWQEFSSKPGNGNSSYNKYRKYVKSHCKLKYRYLIEENAIQIYHPDMKKVKTKLLNAMYFVTKDKSLKEFKYGELDISLSSYTNYNAKEKYEKELENERV